MIIFIIYKVKKKFRIYYKMPDNPDVRITRLIYSADMIDFVIKSHESFFAIFWRRSIILNRIIDMMQSIIIDIAIGSIENIWLL